MKRNINKFCAATTIAAVLLSASPLATPVAHAGWGSVIGGVIGGILNGGGSGGSSGGGNGGGSVGGLSNQQHAHPHPNDNEKLFMIAVANSDIETVATMLNAGVDINGVYPDHINNLRFILCGKTALLDALQNQDYEMMRFLIENGADLSGFYTYENKFVSYMVYATSRRNRVELANFLIELGADVNIPSDDGLGQSGKFYPMDNCVASCPHGHIALFSNEIHELASFLINQGAYTENKVYNGYTPFLCAADNKDVKLLNILANGGANINARDDKGRNALQIALDGKNLQFYREVEAVMARGQQPSQYQPSQPQTQRRPAESGGNVSGDDELILVEKNTNQKANIQELNKVFDILIQASKDETNALNEFNSYTSKINPEKITVADRSIPSQKMVDAMKRIKESTNPQKVLAGMEHCTLEEKDTFSDLLQIMCTRYEKVIGYFSILATERDLTSTEKQQVKSMMAESQSLQKSIDDIWTRITKMYNR